jgi:hypothetical protein
MIFSRISQTSRAEILSRYISAAAIAAKVTMSEESLFLPGETLPANVSAFVRGVHERVVVIHFPIALLTSNGHPVDCFRIDCFNHLA